MKKRERQTAEVQMNDAKPKLEYKILDGRPWVVFATPERIRCIARIRAAAEESQTWDEFRRAMPADEYARIIRTMFDDNEEPRPKGSDAFDCNDVPGHGFSSFPPALMDDLVGAGLPADICEKYAEPWDNIGSGESGEFIDSRFLEEIRAELERRGFEVVDGSRDELFGW